MSKSALQISLSYLLLGILWIFLSDQFIASPSFLDTNGERWFTQGSGVLFIGFSSILLYLLIRKNTQNLLDSEKRYRQFFEENPNPMWIFERSTNRILAANGAATQKYGYSKEEFSQLQQDDLKPKGHSSETEILRSSNKGTKPVKHLKRNGDPFFVQLHSSPIKYQNRKAGLVTVLDINEKVMAEEKNRDISKQLSNFRYAISSATLVSALDAEGNISWVNENFCRLSQYSSNELIGKSFRFLNSGYHSKSFFSDIWNKLNTGANWRGELMNQAKDGSFFWLDFSIVPIQDSNNNFSQFITISTDITEKKQVQEKLVQREKLLSSLVNSQSSFLIRLNECGGHSYANARYQERFGLCEESIKEKRFQDLLQPEQVKLFEEHRQACLHKPGEIVPLELYSGQAEGSLCWTSWEFIGLECEKGGSFEIQGMGLDITKRKVAEQELLKFEKRFEKVLDSINEAYYTLDHDWKFTKVNKQFEKLTRTKREEVLGHSLWDLFPEISGTTLAQKIKESMENATPVSFDEEYPNLGVWFQFSIYPVQEGLSGYIIDITRKKEAERQIKQAIERFNTLTKATFDTIWEWDLAKDTLNWNDGIKTNFKYSKFAVPDSIKRWGEKVHPDDYKRVIEGIKETIQMGRQQWEEEYRMLCGDGSYRYIIDRGHVIYNEQKKPVRMIGAIQDIHQQREYQQEIRKLSLVAEKTQNAVIITNQNGLIEWVNEGFTRLTGWAAEDVINRKPGNFLQGPETDVDTLEMIRLNLLKKQRFSAEMINYTRSGIPYWVRMDVSPILNEKGELVKYIAIESDITERKQFEERLKMQNEKLKEIAFISSHDVRRPVASILGLISLYDLEDPNKPFNKEIIRLLDISAKELDKVIRKIVYKTYEVDEMKEPKKQEAKA